MVFPALSKFPIKLFVGLLLDQHQVLAVYLNLWLSSYNILWNKNNLAHKWLCNQLIDQSQFFACYHMLLDHFCWLIKSFFSISYNTIYLLSNFNYNAIYIFYLLFLKKIILCAVLSLLLSNNKKSIFSHWQVRSTKNLNIGTESFLILLIYIYSW